MKSLFTIIFILLDISTYSQVNLNILDQKPPATYENIYSQKLGGDSLSTSFLLWIKKSVPLHIHANHSEVVYVISGTADFEMGYDLEKRQIKAGDYIFIPKNKVHGLNVTSAEPLEVISIQSPMFNGSDRIQVDVQSK